MLNRKPLALCLAALFVFCVSGCSESDNDSSGDSGDSAIVECISLDNFSDKAFGEYAISWWDLDGDKCISQSEANKITEIPEYAFKNNNIIESIDDLNLFPSITTLRTAAFAECNIKTANLKYIQIIEEDTFRNTTLTSISLPKATNVGKGAFYNVSSLTSVDLPNVETVGYHAFEGTSLESVSLPKATYVSDGAFYNVSSLTSVDLPNVETVGHELDVGAFEGTSLESVSLPKATYVGDCAFRDVSSLTSVDLPNVETVGYHAFAGTSLESVSLPKATNVGGYAFFNVSTLKTLDLPMATTIGGNCFTVVNFDDREILLDTLYLTSPLPITMTYTIDRPKQAKSTKLYLNINKKSDVSGGSWYDIDWKSITFVE